MGKRKLNKKSPSAKSATSNSTKDKGTKKYSNFREVVKDLIIRNDGANVSEFQIEATESRLIECAIKGDFKIYVPVPCGNAIWDCKMPPVDLLRFAGESCAALNIEKLSLYTEVTKTIDEIYYGDVVPDRNGITPDCPEISKTFRISTDSFQINEEDIPLLAEKIKNDNLLGLNITPANLKTEKKSAKSNPLFMDDAKNLLYFNKDSHVDLRPEEINLIKYMRKQEAFALEQILTEHFKKNLTETFKHKKNITEAVFLNPTKTAIDEKNKAISKGDRNIFDTYKANINKKCQSLRIGDLIEKRAGIKKAFKLSVNITNKAFKL
jgi:hypothetical protein